MSRRRSAERRPRWHYWLLLVVVCALSSLLMVQPGEIPDLQLSSGTLASRDVRAPSSFEFTDEETTEWRRREAEDSVALVFRHRAKQHLFRFIRQVYIQVLFQSSK